MGLAILPTPNRHFDQTKQAASTQQEQLEAQQWRALAQAAAAEAPYYPATIPVREARVWRQPGQKALQAAARAYERALAVRARSVRWQGSANQALVAVDRYIPTVAGQSGMRFAESHAASSIMSGGVIHEANDWQQYGQTVANEIVPKFAEAPVQNEPKKSNIKQQSKNETSKFSLNNRLGFDKDSRFHINGFVSVGVSKGNMENGVDYVIPGHGALTNNVTFAPSSLLGLELTADMAHNLSAVVQLVADGDDTNGNNPYSVNVEWAFLRFRPNPSTTIIAGRYRLPTFLYSQTEQVGYTYPWMFLPVEVYRIVPFNNANGLAISHTFFFR